MFSYVPIFFIEHVLHVICLLKTENVRILNIRLIMCVLFFSSVVAGHRQLIEPCGCCIPFFFCSLYNIPHVVLLLKCNLLSNTVEITIINIIMAPGCKWMPITHAGKTGQIYG